MQPPSDRYEQEEEDERSYGGWESLSLAGDSQQSDFDASGRDVSGEYSGPVFRTGTLSDEEEEDVSSRKRSLPVASLFDEAAGESARGRDQAKRWVFTCNNPTAVEEGLCRDVPCEFLCCQTEVGENGTVHLQGLVCFGKRVSLVGCRRLFGVGGGCRFHFQIMRGTLEQAEAYCTKEDTRLSERFSISRGNRPAPQGARNDLTRIADAIREGRTEREILDMDTVQYIKYSGGIRRALEFDRTQRNWPMHVTWAFGPTGTGKTRLAAEQAPTAYWKSSENFWWCGYCGETDVIIDEMRGDFCKYGVLLALLDRNPFRLQIKGGSRQLLAKRIFITSSLPPWKMYPNLARDDKLAQLFRRISVCYKFTALNVYEVVDLSAVRIDDFSEAMPRGLNLRN